MLMRRSKRSSNAACAMRDATRREAEESAENVATWHIAHRTSLIAHVCRACGTRAAHAARPPAVCLTLRIVNKRAAPRSRARCRRSHRPPHESSEQNENENGRGC